MPDDRSQREKLEAMAHQSASPNEAKVAEHMLFKRYGHTHEKKAAPAFEFVGSQSAWDRAMGREPKHRHHTGTQNDVLSAFLRGEHAQSRATHVPGGRRQQSVASTDEEGATDLLSYRTVVARRHKEGDISITSRRYSVTTSKMMGRLQGMMTRAGYEPSGETRTVRAQNMGRWGGAGLPWSSSLFDDIPFVHHRRRGEAKKGGLLDG